MAHKGDKYLHSQRFLKIILNFLKFWVVLVKAGKKAAEARLFDKDREVYIQQLSQTSCIYLWTQLFSFTERNQTSILERQNTQVQ